MIIIRKGESFLSKGAIVPNEKELKAIRHALIEERDRLLRGRGNYYGPMTIEELRDLIDDLQKYQRERGA